MKALYSIMITALLLQFVIAQAQPDPRLVRSSDFAVMLNVEINEQTPSITLKWKQNELAKAYYVFRKHASENFFPQQPLASLDSSALQFTDNTVQSGVEYEYEVRVLLLASVGNNDNYSTGNMMGFGYVVAGINVQPKHDFGTVLLVIDNTMAEPLNDEIARLKNDLRGEGWGIEVVLVPRQESFDGNTVRFVKSEIMKAKQKNPTISTVFLLGRVAVPYSGDLYPDAHPEHRGAWPADIYYGYIYGDQFFTDQSVNVVIQNQREANKNVPGDGKFDVSILGGINAELAVGRVDLYDMPAFHDSTKGLLEVELLRNYLNKNHTYRTDGFNFLNKAIIDDNFSASASIELSFSSSGWRNFASLLGYENVRAADWFTTLSTESALWAYGCGGGTYQSAGGIGNTAQFASTPVNSVFTMLFGSYFGDWDNRNNFLRAPLASSPAALTCSWTGRPHWYYHHMGTNYPIGYSALLSHNNTNMYKPNVVWTSQYPNGAIFSIGMKNVHTALMGDPTLTMYSNKVPQVENVSVYVDENSKQVITWSAPTNSEGIRYEVYRSTSEWGVFRRINSLPVTGLTYTDDFDYDGEVYYSVRASRIVRNNSGSMWALSLHNITSVTLKSTDIRETIADDDFNVYPNPVRDNLTVKFTTSATSAANIEILDIRGNSIAVIFDGIVGSGTHSVSWNTLNNSGSAIPQGVYFIKLHMGNSTLVRKINVIR